MAAKKKAAKKTVRKTVAKKTTARRAAPKKKAAAKKAAAPAKLKSITVKQTKTQIIQAIAEDTELTRKQVAEVFGSLGELVQRHMQKRGSGEFTIPETGVKIRRVRKPARKARMGRNPATGEAIKIAAKPASTVVKVTALKGLKETVK
jgi:nucleoid DNA-binding protein